MATKQSIPQAASTETMRLVNSVRAPGTKRQPGRRKFERSSWHLSSLNAFIFGNTGGFCVQLEEMNSFQREGLMDLLKHLAGQVARSAEKLSEGGAA